MEVLHSIPAFWELGLYKFIGLSYKKLLIVVLKQSICICCIGLCGFSNSCKIPPQKEFPLESHLSFFVLRK